jgi:hypothetical protein
VIHQSCMLHFFLSFFLFLFFTSMGLIFDIIQVERIMIMLPSECDKFILLLFVYVFVNWVVFLKVTTILNFSTIMSCFGM